MIRGASDENSLLTITFGDGSTMNVKVAPSVENTAATGKMEGAPTGARVWSLIRKAAAV